MLPWDEMSYGQKCVLSLESEVPLLNTDVRTIDNYTGWGNQAARD